MYCFVYKLFSTQELVVLNCSHDRNRLDVCLEWKLAKFWARSLRKKEIFPSASEKNFPEWKLSLNAETFTRTDGLLGYQQYRRTAYDDIVSDHAMFLKMAWAKLN